MSNEYATRAQLKARVGLAPTDTAKDAIIDEVLEGVSREIDNESNRRLFAATDTRYYTAVDHTLLQIDDLITLTTLKTDEDGDRTYEKTWAVADRDLEPLNAALESRPYTQLRTTPKGAYSFPLHRKGVEIVGSFGYWSSTPPVIREACLIQAARIFRRVDVPFGIVGMPEGGAAVWIGELDPDVKHMLRPFVNAVMA